MPKMGSGVRTSRSVKRKELLDRLASELAAAAEQYGFSQTEQDLRALGAVADRVARQGLALGAMKRATERGVKQGEDRRAAMLAAEAAVAPAEVVAPAPVEKRRTRKKAEPKVPEGPMISSPFYPTQPCGLSYKDFRVGHTYKDAYHMLMTAPREEGTYRTITQRAVLRQLARMKRQTYEQYLSDCAAQEQYEVEQAHGGREGEYATDDSGDFDLSFDPSEFAPAEPEDFIAFNPRRKRTSRRMSVEEVWHRLGSPRVNLSELATGIRIESEHGVGPVKAGRIALDHLREFPDYYTRLTKMEERAKKGLAPNSTGLTVEQVPGRHDLLGTSGPYKLFRAHLDGKKAGSLWFPWNHETQDMPVVGVSQVHVEPFARRRGVSTALHNAAAAWLRSKGDFRLGSGMVTSEENAAYWKKLEAAGEARRTGSDEWQMVRNPKIVSLGPHAHFAAAGLAMNARWTSRRPRKATSRKNAPR